MISKPNGFTLMETLLYFGLFAVLAGGGLAAASGIVSEAVRSQNRVDLAEEANFLKAKIGWALAGFDEGSGVTEPASSTSEILETHKPDVGNLRLEADGNNAVLTRADGTSNPLLGSGVRLVSLEFLRGDAWTVSARFTLSSSESGRIVRQDFQMTKSLLP